MRGLIYIVSFALLTVFVSTSPVEARKKPVMAVDEFKNDTNAWWWRGGTGRDLAGMLTNELAAGGEFKMVERKRLKSVLKEQDLAASGRIRKGTGAKMGQITGASYLVTGTVTAFEQDTSTRGGGLSFGGISIGGSKKKAYLAIDIRVINSTTGDIEFVRTIEGKSSGGGLSLGFSKFGVGGSVGGTEKTPAGKAIRACVIEVAEYLECVMVHKDDCVDDYKAKERKRRKKSRGAIDLE